MGNFIRLVEANTDRRSLDERIREKVVAEVTALIVAGRPEAAERVLRDYLVLAAAPAPEAPGPSA